MIEVGRSWEAPATPTSFVRTMQSVDPLLGLKWVASARPHWCITRRVKRREYVGAVDNSRVFRVVDVEHPVKHIVGETGGFRPPAISDLGELFAADLWKKGNVSQAKADVLRMLDEEKQEHERAIDTACEGAAVEGANYLTKRHFS
jgi:hypothetical protein